MPPRHRVSWGSCAAWNGAGREPGRRTVRRRHARRSHARRSHALRKRGDARGLEDSRRSLFQDQLLKCQIPDRTPKARILRLQLLQPLHLIALQTAVLRPPAIISHFRNAYSPNSLCDRPALGRQHLNLPEFVMISSAVCLFLGIPLSSMRHKSHTSGRITLWGQTNLRRLLTSIDSKKDSSED